jgi:hypothetical protein
MAELQSTHVYGDLTVDGDIVAQRKIETGTGNFVATGSYDTITHALGTSDFVVLITPTASPAGALGEVWVTTKTTTSFRVYISGTATTTYDWIAIAN